MFRSYVDNKAVLYTTDGCGQSYIDCGSIPDVYATVDFGVYENGQYNYIKSKENSNTRIPIYVQ